MFGGCTAGGVLPNTGGSELMVVPDADSGDAGAVRVSMAVGTAIPGLELDSDCERGWR